MREITEVYQEGSLEFWRDKSEKLIHRVRQLERQLESIYCSFCGERFEVGDTDGITQHIRVCEKHPMRAAEAEVVRLTEALSAANEDAERLDAEVVALLGCMEPGREYDEVKAKHDAHRARVGGGK